MPSFVYGNLFYGAKLGSSCVNDKHFNQLSQFPSPHNSVLSETEGLTQPGPKDNENQLLPSCQATGV